MHERPWRLQRCDVMALDAGPKDSWIVSPPAFMFLFMLVFSTDVLLMLSVVSEESSVSTCSSYRLYLVATCTVAISSI